MGWLVFISVTQLCLSVKRGVAGFGTLLTRLLKKESCAYSCIHLLILKCCWEPPMDLNCGNCHFMSKTDTVYCLPDIFNVTQWYTLYGHQNQRKLPIV